MYTLSSVPKAVCICVGLDVGCAAADSVLEWNACSLMNPVKVWPTIRAYSTAPCQYNGDGGWVRGGNDAISAETCGSSASRGSGNLK